MRVRRSAFLYAGPGVNFPKGGARKCSYEYRMVLIVHAKFVNTPTCSAVDKMCNKLCGGCIFWEMAAVIKLPSALAPSNVQSGPRPFN